MLNRSLVVCSIDVLIYLRETQRQQQRNKRFTTKGLLPQAATLSLALLTSNQLGQFQLIMLNK